MKKVFYSVLLVLFLYLPVYAETFIYGKADFVPDGDTVILKSGKSLRYIGIDTPETDHKNNNHQFYALNAKEFNRKMVKNKRLKIVFGENKKDRYGRYLGYVYLPDGKMINELMLEKGMGWFYYHKDNKNFKKRFLNIQQRAMDKSKGIWSYIESKSKMVILNKNSFRFHDPECRNMTGKTKNFSYVSQAFYKGYSPARGCIRNIFKYGE
ncbi:MAG: thermonuclease family protein [Thermodesulfobacteriota bacterium]